MKITTITSRDLNQDIAGAKRAALSGPVFITNRGKPAFVLSTITSWQQATGQKKSLIDVMRDIGFEGCENVGEIDFEPPRFNDLPREVDLS